MLQCFYNCLGLRRIAGHVWVMLDLFATNRHPDEWERAEVFDPGRLSSTARAESVPSRAHSASVHPRIVAQEAGPLESTHRCPGEPATVDLLAASVHQLAELRWSVPVQDIAVDLSRIPARVGRAGLRIRVEG